MAAEKQSKVPRQAMPDMPDRVSVDQMTQYDVYDRDNQHIGSTSAIWMDRQNQPAFIGIKSTWLFGKTHVVPAWGAEVNHAARRIRLPCQGEIIKGAPSFPPDEELVGDREREVMDYFRREGACQPKSEMAEPSPSAGEEATTIPLHEEQVNVGKRSVEAGGVRLRKVIRTETVQQPVQLQHEEIQVERVPASSTRPSDKAFEHQDIYIPVRREEPVVEKQTRVREEVRAHKTRGTEQQTVSGQVRKEDVEVENEKQRKAA